jgi:hypothetical protein
MRHSRAPGDRFRGRARAARPQDRRTRPQNRSFATKRHLPSGNSGGSPPTRYASRQPYLAVGGGVTRGWPASGQAPAWPLVLAGVSAVSGIRRDFACTFTRHHPPVLVVMRPWSCWLEGQDTYTQRAIAPAEPSDDSSACPLVRMAVRCVDQCSLSGRTTLHHGRWPATGRGAWAGRSGGSARWVIWTMNDFGGCQTLRSSTDHA